MSICEVPSPAEVGPPAEPLQGGSDTSYVSFQVDAQEKRPPLGLVSIWAACDTGVTGMCSHCWQHLQEKAELRGVVELQLLSFCYKKRCLVMLLTMQQAQMRS